MVLAPNCSFLIQTDELQTDELQTDELQTDD